MRRQLPAPSIPTAKDLSMRLTAARLAILGLRRGVGCGRRDAAAAAEERPGQRRLRRRRRRSSAPSAGRAPRPMSSTRRGAPAEPRPVVVFSTPGASRTPRSTAAGSSTSPARATWCCSRNSRKSTAPVRPTPRRAPRASSRTPSRRSPTTPTRARSRKVAVVGHLAGSGRRDEPCRDREGRRAAASRL